MKTEKLRCNECKEHFVVYVKKKLKFIDQIKGLPNCRHHGGKNETKASASD